MRPGNGSKGKMLLGQGEGRGYFGAVSGTGMNLSQMRAGGQRAPCQVSSITSPEH